MTLGANGRFGYPSLPRYFLEPERRFAFVIRSADRALGFALVTRGSPAVEDPNVLDVAEFFVLRQFRRSGVGRRAALLLWNRLAGRWSVRVSLGNHGALAFWRAAVTEFSGGRAREFELPGEPNPWQVFLIEPPG